MAEAADNYACAHNCYPKKDKSKNEKTSVSNSKSKQFSSEHSKSKQLSSEKASSSPSSPGTTRRNLKCFGCGEWGHAKNKCPNKVLPAQNIARCFNETDYDAPFCHGTFDGSNLSTILRDTGCTCLCSCIF